MRILTGLVLTFATTAAFAAVPSIEFTPVTTAIHGSATSCLGGKNKTPDDIGGPFFSIRDFAIINGTDETLKVLAVRIKTPDYTCVITGDELNATGIKYSVRAHSVTTNSCSLKCGGFLGGSGTYPYAAEVLVSGVLVDANGNVTPSKTSGTLTIYDPL